MANYFKELGFFNLDGIDVKATELDARDWDFELNCDHCGKVLKTKYISACDSMNCEGIWGCTCFNKKANRIPTIENFFEIEF